MPIPNSYVFGKLSARCFQRRPRWHRHYSNRRDNDHGKSAQGCVTYTVVYGTQYNSSISRCRVSQQVNLNSGNYRPSQAFQSNAINVGTRATLRRNLSVGRHNSASRRGGKVPNPSWDKSARHVPQWGGGRRAYYVTPDLSYDGGSRTRGRR